MVSFFLQGMSRPGNLPTDEFAQRRAIFLDELRSLKACAIIHSAPEIERNHDVNFPYRQNSDFIYLTNWSYPYGILVLTPQADDSDQAEVTLFVNDPSPDSEIWTGPRPGLDEASSLPLIDTVFAYADFDTHLGRIVRGYDQLVISFGNDPDFQSSFDKKYEHIRPHPPLIQEAGSLLKEHRLIKSDTEIKALETAINITGQALTETFQRISTLHFEYEVQAEIEYGCKKRGVERLGFPTIVAAGKNATVLHYEGHAEKLTPGELLLLDVGAEWSYYSADVSRTIPVNGTFSAEQALIYQVVLDAQSAAIKSIKPGAAFQEPHKTAVREVTSGLLRLGLLKGNLKDLIKEKAYRQFFMHGTSHWLGLDVHDAGGYVDGNGQPHVLKAGMVLTVEPGIYIARSDSIHEKWWNIGVRIEDDVLVTTNGYRVLSASIPKTIQEIESLMQP